MAKTTYITPHDSNGTTVSFNNQTYKATGLTWTVNDISSDDNIDTSTLDQKKGEELNYQERPLIGDTGSDTGWEVSFDYIGNIPITDGLESNLTVEGGVAINGNATCTSSSVTLAVNDVVRGSATLRLERPADTGGNFTAPSSAKLT